MDHMATFDVASLPQSVDGVGSFRYTTKLSEYLAAGLPVVTGRIPMAYDLDDGWLWRLAGRTPWDDEYIEQLAKLMARADHDEIAAKRQSIPAHLPEFDRDRQIQRVTDFIRETFGVAEVAPAMEETPTLDPEPVSA
jgi:hypothetical protein